MRRRHHPLRSRPARCLAGCLLLCLPASLLASPPARAIGEPAEPGLPPYSGQEIALACPAPEARAFDFWHGEWSVNNRRLTESGWVDSGPAEVRVYPALGGCLTIEHWEGRLGSDHIVGFSARAWDERKQAWVLLLNWPQSEQSTFGTLEGSFRHERGEFFSRTQDAAGEPVRQRFSFADIGADSLRWDQAFSSDGELWHTHWIMEYSRRNRWTELPTFTGPARATARCAAPEYRQLDALLGDWAVATEIARRSGEPKRQTGTMRSIPILEGCAMMDFLEAQAPEDGAPFMAFRVRAWDGERWVQYWYDNQERVFQRFEGTVEGDRLELESRPDPAGPRIDRMTWTGLGTESPEWNFVMSLDGGATWGAHAKAVFSR